MPEADQIVAEPPPEQPPEAPPSPPPARARIHGRTVRHVVAGLGLTLFVTCLALLSKETFSTGGKSPGLDSFGAATAGEVAVVLDPGHGGVDSGASAQGVVEKDLTLDVAGRLAHALAARGVTTRLTRTDDHYVPLETRVSIANALPHAIFVSIHFNDAPAEGRGIDRVSGIETFYSMAKDESASANWIWTSLASAGFAQKAGPDAAQAVRRGQALAASIQGTLIAGTGAPDRGIKAAGLYVTRRVRGPAVLVEGGFVSHPLEARLLHEPAYRQKIAEAIAEGIVRYLKTAPTVVPPVAPRA